MDPVTEHPSHVSMLLGFSVLPQLIVDGLETVDRMETKLESLLGYVVY